MAAKKSAAKKRAKREKGVVDIELTAEQQESIRDQTGGALDISTIRLRPDLNLRLAELANDIRSSADTKQNVANGSDGTWWA